MNLKNLRKKAGFTQKELAEHLHVERSAISKWESGATKPRITTALVLAKMLNCSVSDLFAQNP